MSRRSSISLCMIVRNEAASLGGALDSIGSFASQMVVVDTGSTDDTAAVARSHGAEVHSFEWTGSFSDARNASLDRATGDWIFILDADERVAPEDLERIRTIVGRAPKAAYSMDQWTYLFDPAAVGWSPNKGKYAPAADYPGYIESRQVRLFPNRRSIRYHGEVHETVEPACHAAGVAVLHADITIHHFGRVHKGGSQARKGRLYLELGLRKVADGTADVPSAFELATQLFELGYHAQAREVLQWVVAKSPRHEAARNMLGKAYSRLDAHELAVDTLSRLTEDCPRFSDAWNSLGTVHMRRGDVRLAIEAFERAVDCDGTNANALGNLAFALSREGRFESAEKCLARAARINPYTARFPLMAAHISIAQARTEEAKRCLRELSQASLSYTPVDVLHLCNLAISLGILDEVERLIEAHLERTAEDKTVGPHLAVTLVANGKNALAQRLYALVLERHPDAGEAHNALGCLLAEARETARALIHFSQALKLEPGNVAYLRNLALACETLGLYKQAVDCYASMVALDDATLEYARGRLRSIEEVLGPERPGARE